MQIDAVTLDVCYDTDGILITKSGPGSVASGDDITWTITLTNTLSTTGEFTITDIVPVDLDNLTATYDVGTTGGTILPCGTVGTTVTCGTITLPAWNPASPNDTVVVTITGTMGTDATEDADCAPITNIAAAASFAVTGAPIGTANSNPVVTQVQCGSITIHKVAPLGGTQDFQFTDDACTFGSLLNGGSATCSNLFVGTYNIFEVPLGGWELDDIDCTGAQQSVITYFETGVQIELLGAEDIDCTFFNSTSTDGDPDLDIVKTGPAIVNPGDPLTYVITVTNTGPDVASDVVVTDTVPSQLTAITATYDLDPNTVGGTGNCTVVAFTVTCPPIDIGPAAVDQSNILVLRDPRTAAAA